MIFQVGTWVLFVVGMVLIYASVGRSIAYLQVGWMAVAAAWIIRSLPAYRRSNLFTELERINKLRSSGDMAAEDYELIKNNLMATSGFGAGAQHPECLKELVSLWHRGFRGSQWPLDKVGETLMKATEDWQVPLARLMAYYAYLDRALFDAAHVHITAAFNAASVQPWHDPEFVSLIGLELAFSRGFLGIELAEAEANIESVVDPDQHLRAVYHRAKAAVLAARQDHEAAEEEASKGREALRALGAIIQPNVQAELDWIDWIFEARPAPSGL